jgi:endogenous inhibitor of DNA gyrase (YacG/DUF329 family)
MSAQKSSTKCPTCRGTSVRDGNKVYPFCSPRCQMVDLGRWLTEEYRVPDQPDTSAGGGGDDDN